MVCTTEGRNSETGQKKKLKIPVGEKPQGCSPATMRATNDRWSNDHPRPQTPSDSFTSCCRWMISER